MRIVNYWKNKDGMWGMEVSVDLNDCDSEIIRDADLIKEFLIQLCDLINMKRFKDPIIVRFGDDPRVCGYSALQLIETSLVSGHFAETSNAAYINVFSCKEFDPEQVEEFCEAFFKAKEVHSVVNYRK
jgi:S-adenosylmethionine/arginine decarboxylase-like enzyme